MLDMVKPARIFVFEDGRQVSYPDFSGNDYLNYFLKEIASSRGIEVRTLQARGAATAPIKKKFDVRGLVRTVYKRLLMSHLKTYFQRVLWANIYDLMVCARLRHCGDHGPPIYT
jgi:hypothetical protein